MPELSADEHAAAILDRLPIVFQENHGEVFLAWVSQAIREHGDAREAAQRERDAQRVENHYLPPTEYFDWQVVKKELKDIADAIRRAGER